MRNIAVLGGDKRQKYLADFLKEDGYNTIRLFDGGNAISIDSAFDTVVLPMPISRDGFTLNAPLHTDSIHLSYIFGLCSGKAVFGGGATNAIKQMAKEYDIEIQDYLSRDELGIKNGVATAEGAIAEAIFNTEHTLWGSRILIVGNGKIGKALAKILDSMGAVVSVSARKAADLAQIEANGIHSLPTAEIASVLPRCNIVFNTVPAPVLGIKELSCCRNDALIIELASAPGGIDTTTAKRLNLRVLNLPSLPGRFSPVSAAKYIEEAILNISKEVGL